MSRLNIAFDLDGTCIDLHSQFSKILLNWTGIDVRQASQFHIDREFNISKTLLWAAIRESYRAWEEIEIFPGVEDLMKLLYDMTGDPIYFVTARPKKYASETFQLIERFCPHPFKVSMCEQGDEKLKYLKNYMFYVEDRRKTAIDLAVQGKVVYMPKRAYNKLDNIYQHFLLPIDDMNQLISLVDCFVRPDE